MKKILLAIILAVTSLGVSANQWIGTEFGAAFGGIEDAGTFILDFSPEYGHSLNSRCALGAQFNINVRATSGGGGIGFFGIGPFFRYYFTQNPNFNIAGDVSLMFGHLYDLGAMLRVRPVVSYRFRNNWEIFGRVNLLEVGYFRQFVGALSIGTGVSVGFTKNF